MTAKRFDQEKLDPIGSLTKKDLTLFLHWPKKALIKKKVYATGSLTKMFDPIFSLVENSIDQKETWSHWFIVQKRYGPTSSLTERSIDQKENWAHWFIDQKGFGSIASLAEKSIDQEETWPH